MFTNSFLYTKYGTQRYIILFKRVLVVSIVSISFFPSQVVGRLLSTSLVSISLTVSSLFSCFFRMSHSRTCLLIINVALAFCRICSNSRLSLSPLAAACKAVAAFFFRTNCLRASIAWPVFVYRVKNTELV